MYLEMRKVPMKSRTLMRNALGTAAGIWHPTDWRPSTAMVLFTVNWQGCISASVA